MESNHCNQDVRISLCPSPEERSQALLGMVARGRSSLGFALGGSQRRTRLLIHSLDWSRVVVAWRCGRPVGYALLRFAGRGPYQPDWRAFINEYGWLHGTYAGLVFYIAELWGWFSPFYIYSIRVMPKEQGQGIGKVLLNAVLEHASACGYDRVELHVGRNFEIAKRLYERVGFLEVGCSRWLGFGQFLLFTELVFMRCTLQTSDNRDAFIRCSNREK